MVENPTKRVNELIKFRLKYLALFVVFIALTTSITLLLQYYNILNQSDYVYVFIVMISIGLMLGLVERVKASKKISFKL